jgi:hypothetical protein
LHFARETGGATPRALFASRLFKIVDKFRAMAGAVVIEDQSLSFSPDFVQIRVMSLFEQVAQTIFQVGLRDEEVMHPGAES